MLDHLGIQCADVAASAAFYDAVLAPLGGARIMDFGVAIGFGIDAKPDFWLGAHDTGDGFRESHIAFTAPDRAAVDAFFAAAVAAGAEVLHEPRVWPEYHPALLRRLRPRPRRQQRRGRLPPCRSSAKNATMRRRRAAVAPSAAVALHPRFLRRNVQKTGTFCRKNNLCRVRTTATRRGARRPFRRRRTPATGAPPAW